MFTYNLTVKGNDAVGLSKKKAGFSFLERAVQGAKRVGATFDPDTVAHLEQAWKVRKCGVDCHFADSNCGINSGVR